MKQLPLLLCLILLAGSVAAQTTSISDIIDIYDQEVDHILTGAAAPGAAIVIVENDRVAYVKCFGIRQVGRPEKVDPHTTFRIASVSKGFASVLTGILVDEGRLSWNDPIVDYVPSPAMDIWVRASLDAHCG